MIELLEKRIRLHGGKEYLTTVRVIAECNGSFIIYLRNAWKNRGRYGIETQS